MLPFDGVQPPTSNGILQTRHVRTIQECVFLWLYGIVATAAAAAAERHLSISMTPEHHDDGTHNSSSISGPCACIISRHYGWAFFFFPCIFLFLWLLSPARWGALHVIRVGICATLALVFFVVLFIYTSALAIPCSVLSDATTTSTKTTTKKIEQLHRGKAFRAH